MKGKPLEEEVITEDAHALTCDFSDRCVDNILKGGKVGRIGFLPHPGDGRWHTADGVLWAVR